MSEKNNILSYLEKNKKRLFKEYHLTHIGLFGSTARGEDIDESDIDVLVEFEPETPNLYEYKYKLKNELQQHFNRPVDICRLKYIKPIFKSRIQSDAIYV